MFEENENLGSEVASLASSSCVDLFEAYGVPIAPNFVPWQKNDERMFCGVIGFVGARIRGTCLLAGTRAPLEGSCPEGGRLRDWVGELANQLVGRLKTKLLARGVPTIVTTPAVLSGIRLEPIPRGKLE